MGKSTRKPNFGDDGANNGADGGATTTPEVGPVVVGDGSGDQNRTDGGKDSVAGGENGTGDAPVPPAASGPADPAAAAGPAIAAKRRGRPPGSGSATKAAITQKTGERLDINQFASTLMFLNGLIFNAMKLPPELHLKPEEAIRQAQAYGALMEHYNVAPPKAVQLWVGAIGISGAIYGPRFAFVVAMKKRATTQGEQTRAPDGNVVDMQGHTITPAGGKMDFSGDVKT